MGMKLGSLVLILLIVILLFGTRRLRNIGDDLAVAVKNFRDGLKDTDKQGKND